MISLLKKVCSVAICTAAISCAVVQAKPAHAVSLTLKALLNSAVEFDGFIELRDDWQSDSNYTNADLVKLTLNSVKVNSSDVPFSPRPVELVDFTGSSFSVPVDKILSGIIPNDNSGTWVGNSADNKVTSVISWGGNTSSAGSPLEYAVNLGGAELSNIVPTGNVSEVFSVKFTPVPEPASILGVMTAGLFGAGLKMKRKYFRKISE
ncbi:PEP-CTERM sorting domain-containing protein [Nostoc sp. MG11]|uniref:PEP-CTERM sorting domain-containing protein n=1 Tax=Nostoc sp. MG11 TaxID=2721166 RepID=UPI001867D681|nr:PEP-CTERM sorting domain-containing protein [Nostoc sp. MG11]